MAWGVTARARACTRTEEVYGEDGLCDRYAVGRCVNSQQRHWLAKWLLSLVAWWQGTSLLQLQHIQLVGRAADHESGGFYSSARRLDLR